MHRVGGLSDPKPATPEIQEIADKVKSEVQLKLGENLCKYVAVVYSKQVVAGINYFVKIQTGDATYVHVRIFSDLDGNIKYESLQSGKTKDSKLEYF